MNADRHRRIIHKADISNKKIKPLKIFQQRPEEILCEVDVNGITEILWMETRFVELDGLEFVEPIPQELPLVDFDNWFEQPWTED